MLKFVKYIVLKKYNEICKNVQSNIIFNFTILQWQNFILYRIIEFLLNSLAVSDSQQRRSLPGATHLFDI